LKTIRKALEILEQFSETRPVLGITELSDATGINKSIVHKILQTLMEGALIARDSETRRYRLGSGIVNLAGRHLANLRPLDIARPHLLRLWEETAETIHFVVQESQSIMITQVYESPQSLRVSSHLGEVGSLHGSAAGKVFLAFGSPSQLERFLEGSLEILTPKTITDPDKLQSELEKVRRLGYSTSREEQEIDFCAIAAPIFDTTGKMPGAVAIAVPPSRFKSEKIAKLSQKLLMSTNIIMDEFGTSPTLRPKLNI
jgi:DNA-binding IclR family transcriptional regulator